MKIQHLFTKRGDIYHISLKLSEAKILSTVWFSDRLLNQVNKKSSYITIELYIYEMTDMIKRLSAKEDTSKIAKSMLEDWKKYQSDEDKYLLTKYAN